VPKDRELAEHERAHPGTPGFRVRHGMDAIRRMPRGRPVPSFMDAEGQGETKGPIKYGEDK
jgi:hypothetical protein